MFTLRFKPSDVIGWAARYGYPREEDELLSRRDAVRTAGKLDKSLLQLIANWKSPRSAWHIAKNSETFVGEVTAFAFSAKDERSRIESLTLLDGVS